MPRRIYHQKLPRAGAEREALREKGQFWTPGWVAEAMVSYVVGHKATCIFDPAVGAGAFFIAAKNLALNTGRTVRLCGTEIDPRALEQALAGGLVQKDLKHVELRDFVLNPPTEQLDAIVANPPYIRHHRIPLTIKTQLRELGVSLIGSPIDGRAGYHIYFLLRALQLLAPDGRLAFIMPADTCEGVFASKLWRWITSNYCLDAVITFLPDASPFPGVDTNPLVFMIRRTPPSKSFFWARCLKAETPQLRKWTSSDLKPTISLEFTATRRILAEGLTTGLSRSPTNIPSIGPRLSDFARVMRGIATGDNDFFFLTRSQATALDIPSQFLLPAIGRTRDVAGPNITHETLQNLESAERPTYLFSPDGRPLDLFPEPIKKYLRKGEALGLPKRALIASRRPWYKMETRSAPPILFSYLGRRNCRFIRNLAGAIPLTGFLCIYPKESSTDFVDKLWRILQNPDTLANLHLVGKSYGSGALKVEPRALERLPLPAKIVECEGLPTRVDVAQPEFAFV